MEYLVYLAARAIVRFVQRIPLPWVARLGRAGGGLAYLLDARHRRVAVSKLTKGFGNERPAGEIRALARENFRRIGENFACAIKTAGMTIDELRPVVEFVIPFSLSNPPMNPKPPSMVVAIGHFGN